MSSWAAESKETLRKLAIGKEITIKVDYTRTVTGVDGDVKYTYVTAETVGKNSINLAEEMVKRYSLLLVLLILQRIGNCYPSQAR